ncbi:MAG: mucoidy inhibitor MuiA family protein [Candidatus Freyarchaeota archaeon]|nr:mucoidy inhibitor MuiA family protein [Candidatus Freyrarchaeum guaymaensis]
MSVLAKIEEVKIFRNLATLRRTFSAELKEGSSTILVEGLEKTIIPGSIRVFSRKGVTVTGADLKTTVVGIDKAVSEKELLLRELRELKEKVKTLESEIEESKKLIESFDKALSKAAEAFVTAGLVGEASKQHLNEVLEAISEIRKKKVFEIIERERELSSLNDEIKRIEVLLEGIDKKAVELGAIELDLICERADTYDFILQYEVSNAGWSPVYDVLLEGQAEIAMYAQVVQSTGVSWEDVPVTVSGKIIRTATKPEPAPWFINAIKPGAPSFIPPTRAPKMAVMTEEMAEETLGEEMEEALEPAFQEADLVSAGALAFKVSSKGSFFPGRPTMILLKRFDVEAETYYVWDAYQHSDFVEIVKIRNGEVPLSPGTCRMFKDGMLVGTTSIPYVAPNQEFELPIAWEERLECERKMILREEEKKGMVKGKAHVTYGYFLSVKNHLENEAKLVIYDRIPVARDPEISVELVSSNPSPDEKSGVGVIKWERTLNPGGQLEINYKFTVSYPPDYIVTPLP